MHNISGMGWGMGLIWLLGLAVLIVIVRLVSQIALKNNFPSKTALDILKERLARGEISDEEYNKLKQNLR